MAHFERIIVLVDMDCFYCQVEEKLDPNLAGKPIAVVQYNAWRGGGIIAVNYPARDRGVTRHMRGDEAKGKCPDIILVKVPNVRGKADLTKYREAGKRVAEVLQTFTPLLERASVDEAYLDITESVNKRLAQSQTDISIEQLKNTHVVGFETADFLCNIYNGDMLQEHNLKLAVGGAIVEEIRAAVYEKTGYRCSAGIAHNKILAKLGAGLHKPNKQTILPQDGVDGLYETLPVRKIRSLGGKFGASLSEDLGIQYMGELKNFSEKELIRRYDEKTAHFLYNIARGIDTEPVTTKLISKSIGCCKKFPGRTALCDVESVGHWLKELSEELSERLDQDIEENNRKAKHIVVSFTQEVNKNDVASTRTVPLYSYEMEKIQKTAMEVINKHCLKSDGSYHIKYLGLSVGKFEDCRNSSGNIADFFKRAQNSETKPIEVPPKILAGNKPKGIMALFKKYEDSLETDTIMQDRIEEFPRNIPQYQNENSNDKSKCSSESYRILKPLDDQNSDRDSVYSADTIIVDEDYFKDYPEYDDVIRKKINGGEILSNNNNVDIDDDDSISNEIFISNEETKPKSEVKQVPSFFKSYFQNIKTNPEESTSRDFNTSKSLFTESEDIAEEEVQESGKISSEIPSEICGETCEECGKDIPMNEVQSHKDYHFALKLVKEESAVYKQNAKPSEQKSKSPVKSKSRKRKSSPEPNQGVKKLTSFFSVMGARFEDESATEVCEECGKKIWLNDVEMHKDYHAAKRLHLEINPPKNVNISINTSAKTSLNSPGKKDKKKLNKSNSKNGTVLSFFKPL